MTEQISIREFARRDGCNDKLVRRAILSKRLSMLPGGLLDAALVGTSWRNRRPTADIPHIRTRIAADVLQNPQKMSAPITRRDRNLIAALIDHVVGDVAEILATKLSPPMTQEITRHVAGELRERASAILELLGAPPPEVCKGWREWPAFSGDPLDHVDWAQLGVPSASDRQDMTKEGRG